MSNVFTKMTPMWLDIYDLNPTMQRKNFAYSIDT
jgi:hypothetical protein